MERRFPGQALAWAIGLAPVFLLPLTWTPHGPEPWMVPMRAFAVPVLIMELVAILVALATGFVGTLLCVRLPKPAAVAAVIMALVLLGTIPFAPVPEVAATGAALWVVHIFFGLSVMHLVSRLFCVGDLVRVYALSFVIFSALFILLVNQVRNPTFDWSADLPGFNHVRIIGHYAAPMVALGAGLMALSRSSAQWIVAFVVTTVAFALSLWTGSRGALIGAAAAISVGLLFAAPVRRPRAWGGWLLSIVLAWTLVSNLPAPSKNMGSTRIVTSTVESDNKTTGRAQLWPLVAKAIAKRPIFGHGEGQMYYVANFANILHPHNFILQILLAWGIVGLGCVSVLGFYLARGCIQLVRSGTDELVPPFMAMAALAAPSLVDGSLFHLIPVSIFAACAGMIGSAMLRATAKR